MYNSNNYGFNPYSNYGSYMPQNNMDIQTPVNTNNQPHIRQVLNGKQVDSIDVVKALEYPLDGSISYFPLTDGSAIVTKQLRMDGTSKTIVYKPVSEEEIEKPKYVTFEDLEASIKSIDLSDIDDLKDDIIELRQSIKDIKKKKKDE